MNENERYIEVSFKKNLYSKEFDEEKIKLKIKKDDEITNFNVDYILMDNTNNGLIYATKENSEDIVQLELSTFGENYLSDFDYDYDFFNKLEKGLSIIYIHPESHFKIWEYINNYYPESIEYQKGVKKYLKFCEKSKITKEVIDNFMGTNIFDITHYNYDLGNSFLKRYKITFCPFDEYLYNVQILTSLDNGKHFYYAGNGRFCKDREELEMYTNKLKSIGITELKKKQLEKER